MNSGRNVSGIFGRCFTQPSAPLQKAACVNDRAHIKLLGLDVVKAPPPSCRHGDAVDKRGNKHATKFITKHSVTA